MNPSARCAHFGTAATKRSTSCRVSASSSLLTSVVSQSLCMSTSSPPGRSTR